MTAGIVTDLTDWLDRISGHWWFLLIILAVAFLDSVVPIVPSETCVIIGGVAAGLGTHNLLLVILAGALGAFLGDNTAFLIGLGASAWFLRRAQRKPQFAIKMGWAQQQIHERGGLLLITARFIPGGRTAVTLSCGVTRQRHSWFIFWVAIAVTIWATYAALLGRIGGAAFQDDHTKAFLLAFGLAVAINAAIELVRHVMKKRKAAATAGSSA